MRNAVLQNHTDSERFAFCTAQVSEFSLPLRLFSLFFLETPVDPALNEDRAQCWTFVSVLLSKDAKVFPGEKGEA